MLLAIHYNEEKVTTKIAGASYHIQIQKYYLCLSCSADFLLTNFSEVSILFFRTITSVFALNMRLIMGKEDLGGK